ncbi:glycosyl transferase family 2 [Cyanosarcina cf. burmensis CCALA 770]|nr:glycosyl transferase family 2 [Cyanosarcina cf. burmensis CCALA 770]
MNIPVSILILTKNEEKDLPDCLESVSWSDDVHVYDSFSTDRTVAIAEQFSAKVTQRVTDSTQSLFGGDESEHRNWGLRNIPFKYSWVFQMDADERLPAELATIIHNAVVNAGDKVAFRVQRRDFFMDRWLKHVQASPFYVRLFRPDKMRYERIINPISIPNGSVGQLEGFINHYPFSKGISHWLERHNYYSSFEAQQIINNKVKKQTFSIQKAFFHSDFNVRRFHQKELIYRLPARPLIKFIILYILKRGFLDGKPGLTYALLQTFYEYTIDLKIRELEA